MENLYISRLETEMRRQLVEDMVAKLRLCKPFHSVKGCIKFEEPRHWFGCPVIQIDFCLCPEFDNHVQLILWLGRKPDEDDFMAQSWVLDSWKDVWLDAVKSFHDRKEADDE